MNRALALVFVAAACSKERAPPPLPGASEDAGTVTITSSTSSTSVGTDGRALVKGACLSCHTEEMLAQQRLTPAQWSKVVTKMKGWGANLEEAEVAPLTAYLASTYGPDAGPYRATPIHVTEATAELEPQPDGAFADGDAEHGRALYTDKCSGCHGPDARGHIGVLLVDRPFLHRADDFAWVVRKGRGKMLPIAMNDREIADVLAHLRRLRLPLP